MLTIKSCDVPGEGGKSNWLGPAPWINLTPPGPKARGVLDRQKRSGPHSKIGRPLVAHRAHGSVVEDVDGNRYIDFASGHATAPTGHTHELVVEAISLQAKQIIHFSGLDFHLDPSIKLVERLVATAPLNAPASVLLTNSASESMEAAIKFARRATRRPYLLAGAGAYHGWTTGALALSSAQAEPKQGFGPLLPKAAFIDYSSPEVIERQLARKSINPSDVAGLVITPLLSCGCLMIPEEAFMQELRAFCDRHGALLIVDESHTGLGRTGKMYSFEHYGVKPDAIILGTSLASGMPIGALVATTDILNSAGHSEGRTQGGNPVSCAAALATLDLLESSFISNAESMGRVLLEQVTSLTDRHKCLSNARGLGMMAVIDVVKGVDKAATKLRDRILLESFQRGLILIECGKNGIRFTPPLCTKQSHINMAIQVFEEAMRTVIP